MRLSSLATAAIVSTLIFSASADAKDKKPQDPNKKVCRSEVPTGSMMSKSTCHTRAEWQAIDDQNHANADNALTRANNGSGRN